MFTTEVVAILKQAGWYAGRDEGRLIELPTDFQYPVSVQLLLREYGGLILRAEGPGVNIGRNSISFAPLKAEGEANSEGTIGYFSELLSTELYPLGYILNESLFLCIDKKSNMYMAGDYLYWVGDSFTNGINNILLGVEGKQLDESTLDWE